MAEIKPTLVTSIWEITVLERQMSIICWQGFCLFWNWHGGVLTLLLVYIVDSYQLMPILSKWPNVILACPTYQSITGERSEKCTGYWTDGKCFEQNASSQYVHLLSVSNSRLYCMRSKSVTASAGIQCARDIPLVSDRGPKQAYSVTSPLRSTLAQHVWCFRICAVHS